MASSLTILIKNALISKDVYPMARRKHMTAPALVPTNLRKFLIKCCSSKYLTTPIMEAAFKAPPDNTMDVNAFIISNHAKAL